MKAALAGAGRAFAWVLLGLVELTALLLSPFRIGRLLRKVSLPRLHDHPMRTTISVLGVITGVAAVVAVMLVNRSIIHSAQSTVDDVAGRADLQINASTGAFDETTVEGVRDLPGVLAATPILQQTVRLREPSIDAKRMLLLGVDLASDDDTYFRTHHGDEYAAINADPIAFLDSASHILITRSLADSLGRKLHDKITLQTPAGPTEFEIWGLLENSTLASAFGGGVGVMHHQAMQVAFGRGTDIDRIDVALARGADADAIGKQLQEKLGGLHVEVPQQKRSRLARMLLGLDTAMTTAGAIAVLIAVFLIYNTMLISVVQRKAELGIMRSLGTTKKQMIALLTLEGALLGAVGSAIGAGIGVLVAMVLLSIVTHTVGEVWMNVAPPGVHIDASLLLACFVFGCITSTIAALIAASSAARISPLESLRTAALMITNKDSKITRGDVIGVLALASVPFLVGIHPEGTDFPVASVGSAFVLLLGAALLVPRAVQVAHWLASKVIARAGVEAQMANENLTRDLMRTSVTAGALMLGVGMAGAFAIFINSFVLSATRWIEEALPGDLIVGSAISGIANMQSLPPEVGRAIDDLKLQGVVDMQQIRVADFTYEGSTIKLTSVPIGPWARHSRPHMVEGTEQGVVAGIATDKQVGVSENFSHRFNKHLGDKITLQGKEGPIEFEVAGVYIDYTSDLGVVWMDRQAYLAGWKDDTVDQYKLHVAPGVDVKAMREQIVDALVDRYDVSVLTGGEYTKRMTSEMERVFSVMRALQAVALVIAVLGVINALSANVLDRTREIGVLRAVGMLRKQVRKLIVIEAALMGTCGALLGVAVGFVFGRMMLTDITVTLVGWSIPLAPDWVALAQMVVSVVVASAIAGFYPARSAANLRVPEAIGYR